MLNPQSALSLIQRLRTEWVGPHFYIDLIRLARKGWPTAARVLFLGILLVSMGVIHQSQGAEVPHTNIAEFARRAHNFAYLLIVMQDILILLLLPVYVASAIAEEKENQTLESLALTHLTDRELVLGKLGARLMHVGALALSSFPIMAFMHLWGNVDIALLLYHEANLFLLLLSAGSVCIWISSSSESVFQAISNSYPALALLGVFGIVGAFVLPWICGSVAAGGRGDAEYLFPLVLLMAAHGGLTAFALSMAIDQMARLRREERRRPRKATTAPALSDRPLPEARPGKRGQVRSRIHPWAWPVSDNALFWKECIKDGSTWSLSWRWCVVALAIVLAPAFLIRTFMPSSGADRDNLIGVTFVLTFTPYFVSLAAYALVVLLQMTTGVAGEREQGTLIFLLVLPVERHAIFLTKWLGPWWRNWPILAISYLGIVFGLGAGVLSVRSALLLFVLPWPLLLMLGCISMWLSVLCRRVLFANIAMVGIVGAFLVAHIALWPQTGAVLALFIELFGGTSMKETAPGVSWDYAAALALGEQAIFLAVAGLCAAHAYWTFGRKDYSSS